MKTTALRLLAVALVLMFLGAAPSFGCFRCINYQGDVFCAWYPEGGYQTCSDEGWACALFFLCDVFGIPPESEPEPPPGISSQGHSGMPDSVDQEQSAKAAGTEEDQALACSQQAAAQALTMPKVDHSS